MHIIFCNNTTDTKIPLFSSKIACGFPSPADDYIEGQLDLNQYLIQHPMATFFIRVAGNSMTGVGIFDGDLLIVDRALSPVSGSIIIAAINGELTVKQLKLNHNKAYLMPANPAYKVIEINPNESVNCWGVVTYAIHDVKFP